MNRNADSQGNPFVKNSFWIHLSLISLLVLVPSGLALHISDSEANRHAFMTIHNLSAVLFLVSVIPHILKYRGTILRRIINRAAEAPKIRVEFIVAAVIVLFVITLGLMHVFHHDLF